MPMYLTTSYNTYSGDIINISSLQVTIEYSSTLYYVGMVRHMAKTYGKRVSELTLTSVLKFQTCMATLTEEIYD